MSKTNLNNSDLESWFSIIVVLNFKKIEFRADNSFVER
jgi:hypothetical protein